MPHAGFNDETAAKLAAEGVGTVEPVVEPVVDTGLPAIDLIPKVEPKVEPAAEPTTEEIAAQKAADEAKANEGTELTDDEQAATVTKALSDEGFNEKDILDRVAKAGGKVDNTLRNELKAVFDPDQVDEYADSIETKLKATEGTQRPNADADIQKANEAQQAMNKHIYDSVGGEDKFKIMAGALNANLDTKTVALINAKLRSTDQSLVDEGMQQAVQAYHKLTGRGNNRMEGDTSNNGEAGFAFMTKREYQSAITSDKYKTDKAYANKVDADRLKSRNMDAQTTMPGMYHNVRDGKRYEM